MTVEAIGQITLDAEVASEAIRYLLLNAGLGNGGNANIGNAVTSNNTTGQITTTDGTVIGYLYEWMSVRYADSADGSANFSNNYANTHYIGLRNSSTQTVSENPADYVWTQVAGNGFGTTYNPYYRTTGGRDFRFTVSTTAPDSTWAIIPTNPTNFIDLDKVSGTIGSNGQSVFQSTIYQRATTQPTTPTGGTYNFATSTQTFPVNWYGNVPVDDGRPAWAATTFYSAPYNGTANNAGWTTPVLAFQNGTNGISGTSFYEVTAYANNPTTPATPTGGQWNFNTNTGTAPTGTVTWYLTPPTTANLWASYALATNQNGNIANLSGWTVPVQLAVTGAAGQDGLSTFQWPVFTKSVTVPATPTGGNYYFGNASNTVLPGPSGANWTGTPNAAAAQTGNGIVWISESVVSRQGTVGFNTNTPQWSTPIQYLGSNGANGIDGYSTFIWPIYQYSTSVPSAPTGGQQWDFQTGTGTPPTGWYNNATAIGNFYPIWVSQAIVMGNTRYANVANNGWSTPVQWTGPQGIKGDTGNAGANAYSYGNSFQPSLVTVVADYRGIPSVLPTNITYYPTVNGVAANLVGGGGNGNLLWTYSNANTNGTGGVQITNIRNGQSLLTFDISQSSNLTGAVTIGNVKVTVDGNISNAIEIGSPTLTVNQVRQGQSPGWYEVTVANTTANSISTYPFPITGTNANVLTNAWRTQYSFGSSIYPADQTILKFNQQANIVANVLQYPATSLYAQWNSNSNSYVGFTSITNGNTIIDGTLNTLNATVGNAINSQGFVPTYYANSQINPTTAPQAGWSLTKDGNLYAKNAFLDGANISNVSVSQLTAGTIGVVANVGQGIQIDGTIPRIRTYDPTDSSNLTYSDLTAGSVKTYIATGNSSMPQAEYGVLTRIATGTATNGSNVRLPGYWRSPGPQLLVSPQTVATFVSGQGAATQTINFSYSGPTLVPGTTKEYYFIPYANLSISGTSQSVGVNSTLTSTANTAITFTNFLSTTANTNSVSVNLTGSSVRGTGVNNTTYAYRQYNVRLLNGTTAIGTSAFGIGATTGAVNTVLNFSFPTITSGTTLSLELTPIDAGGTFSTGAPTVQTYPFNGSATYTFAAGDDRFNFLTSFSQSGGGAPTWPAPGNSTSSGTDATSGPQSISLTWSNGLPPAGSTFNTSVNVRWNNINTQYNGGYGNGAVGVSVGGYTQVVGDNGANWRNVSGNRNVVTNINFTPNAFTSFTVNAPATNGTSGYSGYGNSSGRYYWAGLALSGSYQSGNIVVGVGGTASYTPTNSTTAQNSVTIGVATFTTTGGQAPGGSGSLNWMAIGY
jgi:hypothetical protein